MPFPWPGLKRKNSCEFFGGINKQRRRSCALEDSNQPVVRFTNTTDETRYNRECYPHIFEGEG